MVHQSMRNGSRVADELYINRVFLVLEDFLFFSLYLFSCRAKQVPSFNQLRLLSCLDSLDTNFNSLVLICDITLLLPVSPTPEHAHYTRTSRYHTVPDIECSYIPCQGLIIVLNLVLFLIVFS
jgi:hypothetical protein